MLTPFDSSWHLSCLISLDFRFLIFLRFCIFLQFNDKGRAFEGIIIAFIRALFADCFANWGDDLSFRWLQSRGQQYDDRWFGLEA